MKKILILLLFLFSFVCFTYAYDQIVQVPQDNGTTTSIEIREINGIYIGPLGERYYTFPSMHELQLDYGNVSNEQIQASYSNPSIKEYLLRNQMQRHADEQQARIDQANKQFSEQVERNNKELEARQKAEAPQQKAKQGNSQNQEKANLTGGDGIIGALFFLIVLSGILIYWGTDKYNNFVRAKQNVEQAFSQITVQLKRRHDLIPNLVEATKGYMGYEKGALEKVTQARQTAVTAGSVQDQVKAENILTNSLRGFYAVVENYPNLKANEDVLKLQAELMDTEDKISQFRQQYNNQVRDYNVIVQSFPDAIVAAICHFEKAPFFQGEAEETQVPQVNLK